MVLQTVFFFLGPRLREDDGQLLREPQVMDSVDQQVLKQLQSWLQAGQTCWLCTIVKTVGSSPRPVGSLLACNQAGQVVGSVSGGCVEEDLLDKILAGSMAVELPECVQYGLSAEQNERLGLPCGGVLHVLIEPMLGSHFDEIGEINCYFEKRECCTRHVDMTTGSWQTSPALDYQTLSYDNLTLQQTFGPRFLLLLVGAGQLSICLAQLASMLDYRVVVCDPRQNLVDDWPMPEIEIRQGMPDDIVRDLVKDQHSIVITLTHDPRIDDMALMEALSSKAFYIGALGSQRTSAKRRKRLAQLGLTTAQLDRLHAPVGLSIGSKTPPEIAIAILAELTQLRYG